METPADKARRARLQRLYSISPEEYDTILSAQGGLCAICQEQKNKQGKTKLLGVDHLHSSGLTRGILCFHCNRLLSEAWTVERARAVLAYLENPPAVKALGEERYGRTGRITNRRKRKRRGSSKKRT